MTKCFLTAEQMKHLGFSFDCTPYNDWSRGCITIKGTLDGADIDKVIYALQECSKIEGQVNIQYKLRNLLGL